MTEWWARLPRGHSARLGMEALAEGRAEAARIQRDFAPRAAGGWRGQTSAWSGGRTVPAAAGPGRVGVLTSHWSALTIERPTLHLGGLGSKVVTPGLSWSATSTLDTGKAVGSLIPCFNNAWWCAATPTYPDGIAVFNDASQYVYLVDMANPTAPLYASASPGGAAPQASLAVSADGIRIVVAYVSGSDSIVVVTSSDGFGSEATVSASNHARCANPVVVLNSLGGFHVAYTAQNTASARRASDGMRQTHVYKVAEAREYQPAQWDEPADEDTDAAFPSAAVSGDADANGDGAMALIVWQSTDATGQKNIRGRGCEYQWFAKASGGNLGEPTPFGDFDTRDVALTSSADPDESRDPCVWCTRSGEFFIGYTEDVSRGQAVVKRCTNPMHGGLAGLAAQAPVELAAPRAGEAQNFVNGWVDEDAGFAIAVWEHTPNSRTSSDYKSAHGAYVDLSDTTGTWQDVNQVSDTSPATEEAANPSVWISSSAEVFVTCVQSDGATGGAVVFEARKGQLT